MNKNRILLVEDDEGFGYILSRYLKMNDFTPTWVKDGKEASSRIKDETYDLGILDIMLPDKDGFALAGEWSQYQGATPFVFLTSKSLKIDKLQGYKLGCIDYIVKPIDEEVFIAKVNALLSRSKGIKKRTFDIGEYVLDVSNQKLDYREEVITLTERETQLLEILAENKNQLMDRSLILKALWGRSDYFNRKSMDVFIFKLRKYLSHDKNVSILNVHGKGFMLKV